ncbi:MAG: hypothetical protein ACREP9_20495 [Candidatus Dormibacteraceae bacterium]
MPGSTLPHAPSPDLTLTSHTATEAATLMGMSCVTPTPIPTAQYRARTRREKSSAFRERVSGELEAHN